MICGTEVLIRTYVHGGILVLCMVISMHDLILHVFGERLTTGN